MNTQPSAPNESQSSAQSGATAPATNSATGSGQNKLMGVLAYLGPLVVIPYFAAKNEPFVRFHVGQGAVLLIIEVAVWLLGTMMWQLWMILNIVNLGALVLTVIGIVNVIQGNQKELPLVGQLSKHLPL